MPKTRPKLSVLRNISFLLQHFDSSAVGSFTQKAVEPKLDLLLNQPIQRDLFLLQHQPMKGSLIGQAEEGISRHFGVKPPDQPLVYTSLQVGLDEANQLGVTGVKLLPQPLIRR